MLKLCLSLLLACVLCRAVQAEDRSTLLQVYEEYHAPPSLRTLEQIEKDLRRSPTQRIYDKEHEIAKMQAASKLEKEIRQRMEAEQPVLCGLDIREAHRPSVWETWQETCQEYKAAWARQYLYLKSLAGPKR
jgi:hypothetical protein